MQSDPAMHEQSLTRLEVDHMVAHHGATARSLAERLDLPGSGARRARHRLRALGREGLARRSQGRACADRVEGRGHGRFIEVANRIGGVEAAKELPRERRGKQFDPALSELVKREGEVILSGLEDIVTWDAVIEAEPALAVMLSGTSVGCLVQGSGSGSVGSNTSPSAC